MDFTAALLSILTIHLMASISPGPDFVIVSQKTLLQGRRAGIACGIGVCVGLLFHMSYSVIGLSAAFKHSTVLAQVIGVVGGCYLILLGYKSIKGSYSNAHSTSNKYNVKSQESSAFLSGLVVNIFNPKAAIYFISLFSFIISPSLSLDKLALVVILIIVIQMAWYLAFISVVTIPAVRVKFDNIVHIVDRLLGALMLLMGIYMIMSYI